MKFTARVSEIAETADAMSGTFEVELKINQGKHKLISGFIAKATIFSSSKQTYLIIPIEALIEGDGKNGFVYTIMDSKAKKIPVEIGLILESQVAITSGLENIEEVVTDGAAYLREGGVVED